MFLTVLLIGGFAAWGLTAHTITNPIGDQPDITPQLSIVKPHVLIKAGQPIPVVIAYKNFHADPAARCAPAGTCVGSLPNRVTGDPQVDVGHVHVYFTPGAVDIKGPVKSVSFCIPNVVNEVNFAGTISGNCPALTPGIYRMSAEFQSDSHVSSLKAYNSPQDIPTSDASVTLVVK